MRIKLWKGEPTTSCVADPTNWHINVSDEKVKEYVEALITLGFDPEVTFE